MCFGSQDDPHIWLACRSALTLLFLMAFGLTMPPSLCLTIVADALAKDVPFLGRKCLVEAHYTLSTSPNSSPRPREEEFSKYIYCDLHVGLRSCQSIAFPGYVVYVDITFSISTQALTRVWKLLTITNKMSEKTTKNVTQQPFNDWPNDEGVRSFPMARCTASSKI